MNVTCGCAAAYLAEIGKFLSRFLAFLLPFYPFPFAHTILLFKHISIRPTYNSAISHAPVSGVHYIYYKAGEVSHEANEAEL